MIVTNGTSWNGIEPRLETIQIMGWSSNSVNFTVDGNYDVNYKYTFIETTQRLTINFNVDSTLNMNKDWVINFH